MSRKVCICQLLRSLLVLILPLARLTIDSRAVLSSESGFVDWLSVRGRAGRDWRSDHSVLGLFING